MWMIWLALSAALVITPVYSFAKTYGVGAHVDASGGVALSSRHSLSSRARPSAGADLGWSAQQQQPLQQQERWLTLFWHIPQSGGRSFASVLHNITQVVSVGDVDDVQASRNDALYERRRQLAIACASDSQDVTLDGHYSSVDVPMYQQDCAGRQIRHIVVLREPLERTSGLLVHHAAPTVWQKFEAGEDDADLTQRLEDRAVFQLGADAATVPREGVHVAFTEALARLETSLVLFTAEMDDWLGQLARCAGLGETPHISSNQPCGGVGERPCELTSEQTERLTNLTHWDKKLYLSARMRQPNATAGSKQSWAGLPCIAQLARGVGGGGGRNISLNMTLA